MSACGTHGSTRTATLTHRIITDATLYGSRKRWRLATVQTFVRHGHTWLGVEGRRPPP
ncbi:hypothetical protein [Tessaracoccus sp. Y1736]